jgi:adenylate kinase
MPPLNLVLLGPPGAGKGTQAERLVEDFKLPYMATGNILREAKRDETELGRKAGQYMDRGDLVPDDLINEIMVERLSRPDTVDGFILDGYPRTEIQAQTLDGELSKMDRSLTATLLIDVSSDEAMKRISGRRQCVKNQHIFNVHFDPPKHPDRCDLDGSRLEIRPDDRPEVVRRRLRNYREMTEPLVAYYERRGVLKRIDGARSTDEVSDAIRALLATLKFEEAI